MLRDSKTKTIQYSKVLVLICLLMAVLGIGITIWGCAAAFITEVVACAIVGMCGSLAITAVVWMLKKSQAENTVKIYLSAYEKVLKMNNSPTNEQNAENNFLLQQQMKEKLLSGMNNAIDMALAESTAPIEKHDI